MIFRKDLENKNVESLKNSLLSECNLIQIRVADMYVLDDSMSLRDGIPKAYYVKDITGKWFYCCESVYNHLVVGKEYVIKEIRNTIIGLFSYLED